jgi:hypothetical protein
MNRRNGILVAGLAVALCGAWVQAQDAQLEKTLIANERAINEAVMKGDPAAFGRYVAQDSWAIDSMSGRMATAEFVKTMPAMAKDMKMTSWDITEPKVISVDANTAVLTYKWTGSGTYQGQPIPSPVWASTVWTKRGGTWTAVFHQESMAAPPGK